MAPRVELTPSASEGSYAWVPVRADGRIVGAVERLRARRWRAFDRLGQPVGAVYPRRRDALAALLPGFGQEGD